MPARAAPELRDLHVVRHNIVRRRDGIRMVGDVLVLLEPVGLEIMMSAISRFSPTVYRSISLGLMPSVGSL
jgi:hypothetical protein